MMAQENRNIPLPIKREVRQRCGFGCVICGTPIYEYDHIEEWSIVKEHKAENLTLLCDLHHKEKTNRLLSKKQVVNANQKPFNVENRISNPHKLNYDDTNFSIIFGDIVFRLENLNPEFDFLIPILIDNKKLISFDIIDHQLFLNLVIFNEDNILLLKIENNELIYSTENWDIEFIANRFTIREGKGSIIFDVEFLIPNTIQVHKAIFYYKDRKVEVDNQGLRTNNFSFQGNEVVGFRIGLVLGEYDEKLPCVFRLS